MDGSKTTSIKEMQHRGDEPHLVREIFKTYQVLISGFAQMTGVPAARFALMRLLANSERNIGIIQLARQLGINPAAVTRQVQELEADGLIRRRSDNKDGRRTYVSLSPKGRRLFGQVHERSHELERTLSLEIGAEEMAAAAETVAKLRIFIEGLR
jgi:DNA-binding MarR family transcriptional regulator